MAYINVAQWRPDQVTDWLKGLDDTMYNYVYSFTNNEVDGRQLLNIRPYELEQLGMHSIGHQEIVLEAVENLRNFHYNLDKENLQFMALHIATAARNLHRQLANHSDSSKIETQILNDITRTISTIHPIIGWLDRSPFHGQLQFNEIRRNMLRLGLEMATSAQRDRFVQNPVDQIKATAEKLERLANYIIQDITDPMLLQPASLNLVTLKKRESELGFSIVPSYHGIHRVTDIKYNSPAHNSGKIEDGDEIVQINYQTVVGWQYKTVLLQLSESLPDVLLTLKKRPKHMKIYGQIYMQPYRLPSKKRNMATRWGENLPSPRAGFLPAPDFNLPLKMKENAAASATSVGASGVSSDTDSSCSDILTPTDNKSAEKEIRLYYPKPRAMLQRRNTICGGELFGRERHVRGLPLWHDHKIGGNHCEPASPSLRDKSISFGFGLELTPRPTTCIGIASGTGKFGTGDLKGSFGDIKPKEVIKVVTEDPSDKTSPSEDNDKSKPGVSKVVRFGGNMKCTEYRFDEKYTCNVEDTILETFEPIPFADDEEAETLEALRKTTNKADNILETLEKVTQKTTSQTSLVEAINPHAAAAAAVRRGRLDKSHSTPAYDNSEEGESDTPPPAIEPRKEFLIITPPVPPPRPKKQSELAPPEVPPPPPKPASLRTASISSSGGGGGGGEQPTKPIILAVPTITQEIEKAPELPATVVHSTIIPPGEKNELHTPTKTRTLTLKKKNNLISKRRKMNLKLLGTGDIQGHLYRRTKDRRGVTFWARLYFVLLDTNLYGFRTKEALKASCLIFLPGFTVSLAKEVHSKSYAFKVYHPSKTFYFATESQEALTQWIDFIRQATLQLQLTSGKSSVYLEPSTDVNIKDLYSETDSSGEENETTIIKNLSTPSPQGGNNRDGTTSLTSTKSFSTPTSSNSSTKQDKRYLGSLRKFTKGSFISKGSSSQNERKPSSDIPVPTEQYRSYRKVPGGSFGIQIGTNTPGYHDANMHPFNNSGNNISAQSGSPNSFTTTSSSTTNSTLEQPPMPQRKLSISSSRSSIVSVSGDSIAISLGPPSTPAPPPNVAPIPSQPVSPAPFHSRHKPSVASSSSSFDSPSKASMKKTFPCNFIHASNPNLVEFDFQTSKTLDYSLPKINPANPWDAQQTMQGFVTLKDLMLQKQEEEAQEMYNNRVLLGVEKKHDSRSSTSHNTNEKSEEQQQQQQQLTVESQQQQQEKWTQKRSLPKTPDYEISFKPDDEDIKRTRTKEGLKLRDFGYELISGDEPISGKTTTGTTTARQHSNELHSHEHSWTAAMRTRNLLKTQQFHLISSHIKGNKKHSSNSCSSTTSSDFAGISGASLSGEKRAGSFKKKGKLEAFKTSKERIFQFSKHSSSSNQQSAMTMTLPLNKKTSEGMSDQAAGGSGIKKSHTYNSELKDKASGKYDAQRKNSAPMPILGKLSLSSASSAAPSIPPTREKKLLGSPLLHRTLFGHHSNSSSHSSSHGVVGGGGGGGGLSPLSTPTACCTGREYDQEIFSQVSFNKVPSYHSESAAKFRHLSSSNCNIVAPDMHAPPPPIAAAQQQAASDAPPLPPHADVCRTMSHVSTAPAASTPEYPNLECPPVFEPEIYSLTDPNANLTFLRRRNNNSGNLGAEAEESQ